MQLRRARDRNHPGFLRQYPGDRDLRRGRVLALRDAGEQIYQRLVRLPIILLEARDTIAEIGAVERGLLVDFTRKEAFSERAKGHKSDSELFKRRNNLRLRLSPPEGVFALQGSDKLNGVCAPDRLHAGFRQAEMLHMALRDQLLSLDGA